MLTRLLASLLAWLLVPRPPRRPVRRTVRPIDALMDAELTPCEQRALVEQWRAWRDGYTLTPDEYTDGDLRHQREYARGRLGKVYRRSRRSGLGEAEARARLLRFIARALDRQRTPRHEVIPALNNYPGARAISRDLDPTYGKPFYVKHRHADGFIRELLWWRAKIENGEELTYEVP